jgi:hypothetical protein
MMPPCFRKERAPGRLNLLFYLLRIYMHLIALPLRKSEKEEHEQLHSYATLELCFSNNKEVLIYI